MGRRDAVEIVGFSTAIDRSGFRCGNPALDDWLRTQAGQQERANNTRTFLAIDPSADGVAGYYATTAYRLEPEEAARVGGLGPRRYPVPAVLLARLAARGLPPEPPVGLVQQWGALSCVPAAPSIYVPSSKEPSPL